MFNSLDQGINALQEIAKALHDADRTNIALVIATAVLAGSTIGIGIWNMKRTNSQIKLSEEKQEQRFREQSKKQDDEIFERVRAWITIKEPEPLTVVFSDGDYLSWERYRTRDPSDRRQPITVRIGCRFTNTGIRPAKNLDRTDHHDMKLFTREEFEKKEEKMMHTDLGPNQEQYIGFNISWGNWLIADNNPIYYGLRISYDNGKTRSFSGAIYKVTKTWSEVISSWCD